MKEWCTAAWNTGTACVYNKNTSRALEGTAKRERSGNKETTKMNKGQTKQKETIRVGSDSRLHPPPPQVRQHDSMEVSRLSADRVDRQSPHLSAPAEPARRMTGGC